MTRKIIRESIGTVKVHGGRLQIYSDHHLIAEAQLTDRQRLQLIAELTEELRYPKLVNG